ncbi:hypothetical protein [Paraburkholderia sp. C35]|uniref:hypothetical protein n=1 Tax=Paraburkholderia sp. C35 TaxID=2126993 RepID=UPI001EF62854|nr:hypothetical protein [Paraburkholderia sp. C35]
MKILQPIVMFSLAVGILSSYATAHPDEPKFADYRVAIFRGDTKVPGYYKRTGNDWYDEMGKMVAAPEVNFAGKYHIGVHSCGMGCRYYTLSDLSNGIDSNALDIFSNDVRSKSTSNTENYIVDLASKSDSKMLIAQYHIQQSASFKEKCRQKVFTLSDDGKMVIPVATYGTQCKIIH